MRVEFLYWEGCPSHPEALERLQEALREEGIPAAVEVVHVASEAEARARGFPGSPTIRIDGRDIQPETAGRPALSCRVYLLEDGRPSPLPSVGMIRRALRAAAGVS